ncbi:FxsA family protein [Cryptosporangium phraense]|uniref:FxsA family protein n=1 Tax=Cryptosporangium phraense TaxID=2593070 RepID=A0A545AZG4_9ACTN|nr:FxsA family protein [Cryptosporangium phraense]TQS46721.1 FxsA family protein [Cryptosporangium phraense]
MRALPAAFVLSIVFAVAEIAVLVQIGQAIGLGWTLLLMLASAVLGSWLLRREGGRAFRALREAAREGRTPAKETAEGAVVLAGSLLMILPGFLSDVVGILLLLPPVRTLAGRLVLRSAARRLPPEVSTALLGPMQVRSKRMRTPAGAASPGQGEQMPARTTNAGAGTVIEGEIDR